VRVSGKSLSPSLFPFFRILTADSLNLSALFDSIATTEMLKATATILRYYELKPVDDKTTVRQYSSGIGEKEGPFWCSVSKRSVV
jgi:hypothetical protein